MAESNERPIIIKRKKVVEAGHHGGAWKVAYADFVTAMMAFFLLMWLLGATTSDQRQGLADYFTPTVSLTLASGGGSDAFGGETLTAGKAMPLEGAGGITETTQPGFGEGETVLREIEAAIMGRGGDSLVEELDRRNVTARVTDEGLVVEMFALPGSPLFEAGTDAPTPLLERLVATVAGQAARTEGGVALEGYVASQPVVRAAQPVWTLSTDRADRLRTMMVHSGLAERRVRRVTGHGDASPATDPAIAERNDRIEVVFLRPGR